MDLPKPFMKYPSDKAIWNEAVIATLREVRKYDGIIKPNEIEYLTKEVANKVAYKPFNHKFKSKIY